MSGIKIPAIDAKDIYMSGVANGCYTLLTKAGEPNLRKFTAQMDYSLDMIHLRETYCRVYKNRRFCFALEGQKFSRHIISLSFDYSYKLYNNYGKGFYVRAGTSAGEVKLKDGVFIEDGQILAIKTGERIEKNKISALKGQKSFVFNPERQVYETSGSFPTIMDRRQLRQHLYEHGFVIDGIHYARFKRSSGAARVGKCLFINQRLYY